MTQAGNQYFVDLKMQDESFRKFLASELLGNCEWAGMTFADWVADMASKYECNNADVHPDGGLV